MKSFVTLLVCSILTIQAWTQEKMNDSISSITLTNKLSILKDRVFLTCPDSAKNIARANDIMEAPKSEENETRIVFDIKDMRLVIFAQEMFARTTPDLLNDLNQKNLKVEMLKFGFVSKIIKNEKGFIAILSTPTKYDEKSQAILINSLTIQNSDSSLTKINAFINPAAYKQKEAYIKLTETIFKTIEQGNRKLNLAERQEEYKILGTKNKLVLSIPNNYSLTIDNGYDFDVYKIKPVNPINDTTYSQIFVYTGDHPSWFYGEYGFKNDENKIIDGELFDKKMTWYYFENIAENNYLIEYQYDAKRISKNMIIHIAIVANSEKEVLRLKDLTEKFRLEK